MSNFDFDEELPLDVQIGDALEKKDIDALRLILIKIKETIKKYPDQAITHRTRVCKILEEFPDLMAENPELWHQCACPVDPSKNDC
ncbi:MAG: hypothetical protein KME46_14875 [Brasilonema angustatum HA4187-MV1]|jgi:hypothetical protein|nr:hypothetical protein [Brasilonema angustatum HA4187-MV1]